MAHYSPPQALLAPSDPADTWMPAPPSSSPSVPHLVGAILRRQGREASPTSDPADVLNRAAVGAAISILGACLSDETIGPLPRLTAGLLEVALAPNPPIE